MQTRKAAILRTRTNEGDLGRRHNALSSPYTLSPNHLLERQAARESNARSYPRRPLPWPCSEQKASTSKMSTGVCSSIASRVQARWRLDTITRS